MKAILFCAACLFCSTVLKAQFIEKDQRVLGAAITFNTSTGKNSSLPGQKVTGTNFSINANAGKFKKKGVLTTYGLSYLYAISKSIDTNNTSKNRIHNVYANYGKTWFKSIGHNFYVGLGGSLSAGYGSSVVKNTNFSDASDSKRYSINLDLAPVLSWQASKRIVVNINPAANFLNLGVGYTKTRFTNNGVLVSTSEQKAINLNTGFFGSPLSNLSVGFYYLLGPKKS